MTAESSNGSSVEWRLDEASTAVAGTMMHRKATGDCAVVKLAGLP
jgi:hypothetical protein